MTAKGGVTWMGIMAADGLSWRLNLLLFSSLIARSIWSTCYADCWEFFGGGER